ncbi:MAG: DNA polymerase elongation subunit, family B [uncultured archaeon A07HR60]|nr:MAG: DNA polymerase elongation subunit, family B [uncultured archaeon A07HR60]
MDQTGLTEFSSPVDEGGADPEEGTAARSDEIAAAEAHAVAGSTGGAVDDVVDIDEAQFPDANGTVEMMITQVDYTVEGRGSDEYPVIHVFGRSPSEDGHDESVHVRVLGVEPYFYVPTESLDFDPVEEFDAVIGVSETNSAGDVYESIRGKQVTRIVTRTPRDVGQVRDEFSETYEADVLFPNRFLVDNGLSAGMRVEQRSLADGRLQVGEDHLEPADVTADIRVNTFDIEVEDRSGFPEDGEEPIVCLTSHDSYTDEYTLYLYEAPNGDGESPAELSNYEPFTGDIDVSVRTFQDEAAMIDAFVSYLDETSPDLTTGWNFEDFDMPYLLDRMEVLNSGVSQDLSAGRLSQISEVWRSGWGGPDVKGRVVFDLLYAYKRTMFTELESYRLDAVGERELDAGKERYPGDVGDLWEDDPERLLEYNLRDVELCVEIDRKQSVVEFWNEARKIVGCRIQDAPTPGDAVDMYVLHQAYGDFVLPTKGQRAGEDFEGGAVFEPITGVREMVSVLDLKSLYPMSMVTINASPETIVDDPEAYDGEMYRAPDDTRFRKEPDGMMREMVDELLVEREELKGRRNQHEPDSETYEKYDRQQASVKVIMNCFTPDTEVMTPDGIRSITDLGVDDDVYSLDPDTMEMAVKPVEETHEYPEYRETVLDIETDTTDLRVTPNHRMLVRKTAGEDGGWDDYRFVEAGQLDETATYQLPHDWDGPEGERLETIRLTDFLDNEYQVWVGTDERDPDHGHTPDRDHGPRLETRLSQGSEASNSTETIAAADGDRTGRVYSAAALAEYDGSLAEIRSQVRIRSDSNSNSNSDSDSNPDSNTNQDQSGDWIPVAYDGDDFLELLAWYIGDGPVSVPETSDSDRQNVSATTEQLPQDSSATPDGGIVAASGASDRERIGTLLDGMGLEYSVDESGYQLTSRFLGETLRELCTSEADDADGGLTRIPELVFEASRRQKRAFFEILFDATGPGFDTNRTDGDDTAWQYRAASERLRDDALRLCAHLGLTAGYTQGETDEYRISASETSLNTLQMDRDAATSTADDGVYCVTVADNHTLLAGRNGKFGFVGQSLYGVSGWEQFRLYDKDNAAAITSMGRRVIEFTEEAASEIDYDVTYGDSVTGERPLVVRDGDGRVRILPAAELFERAEANDHIAIAADGGPAGSHGLGKGRASLPGWEALSLASDGTAEWQPIEEVIRHDTDGTVVHLQHQLGESTTTRDHSYVVEEDGEYLERAPEDVTDPLRIPDVPSVDTVDSIDVHEILDGYTGEHADRTTPRGETGSQKRPRVHTDGESVWVGHSREGESENTTKVQREIDLTGPTGRSLVRLLAAYIRDGSTTTAETADSTVGVSISESRPEWLEAIATDSERLFENAQVSVNAGGTNDEQTLVSETRTDETVSSNGGGTGELRMMDELCAVFFTEFVGHTAPEKHIPSFVYHLNDELQRVFTETLVAVDDLAELASHTEAHAQRQMNFEATSRELAAGVSMLLTQQDRTHSLHYRDETNRYTITPDESDQSARDPVVTEQEHDGYVYDLSVAENENFVDAVGGIVLHNTDSIMLSLSDAQANDTDVPEEVLEAHPEMSTAELENTQAAIEASEEIESFINSRYDDFASEELDADEHRFQIEFEKLYRRFFQAGKKKRYAGNIVWKEGKHVDDVDITGFEYQRSDIAGITKRVQREVIDRIVTGEDLEADLEGVESYLSDEIDAFLEGNMDIESVGIPGGIGKRLDSYKTDTAQVRGAKYANLLFGTNFARGSKPKRLYLDSVHPDFWRRVEDERNLDPQSDPLYGEFKREVENGDGVICFEYADQLPEEFQVDWEKMLEKTLKGPISRVIEAVGTSWEEVKTGQKQSGLEQYF